MKDKIEKFVEYLTTITKEDADFIEDVLKWDDESKAAFRFAKRLFDEDEDE